MATEFPIDPEYGRFVPGISDQPETQEEELEFELPEEKLYGATFCFCHYGYSGQ